MNNTTSSSYTVIPKTIRNELSLELTNGARTFQDYEVSPAQVNVTNKRFIRIMQNIQSTKE
jgi:hypothetical protein